MRPSGTTRVGAPSVERKAESGCNMVESESAEWKRIYQEALHQTGQAKLTAKICAAESALYVQRLAIVEDTRIGNQEISHGVEGGGTFESLRNRTERRTFTQSAAKVLPGIMTADRNQFERE
jgi:hypothetical protein